MSWSGGILLFKILKDFALERSFKEILTFLCNNIFLFMLLANYICLMMTHLMLLLDAPRHRILHRVHRWLELRLHRSLRLLEIFPQFPCHCLRISVHHGVRI